MTQKTDVPPELEALRSSIDNLDASLIFILSERFKLTRKVGELKATKSYPQQMCPEKTTRCPDFAGWLEKRNSTRYSRSAFSVSLSMRSYSITRPSQAQNARGVIGAG